MAAGTAGLLRDKTRPSRIAPLKPDVIERVVALTLTDAPGETTHWAAVMMAAASKISVSIRRRPLGLNLSRARGSGGLLDLDGLACWYPVPREQFFDAGLWMIRHSGDDVGEPGVGIDVVEATGPG